MARVNGLRNASLDDEAWVVSNVAHSQRSTFAWRQITQTFCI